MFGIDLADVLIVRIVADVDGDGLLDIYFVSQLGGNQLWKNAGGGKFQNITAAAGVGLTNRVCVAAAFADIDNDGDPDLFVTTVRMGNVLFENLGNGRFRDISKEAGVDYVGHSSGAVFFDFTGTRTIYGGTAVACTPGLEAELRAFFAQAQALHNQAAS